MVASTISLARRIAAALRFRGFPIKAELRTDDLGVSLRPGRRSTHSLNKRLRLGLSRSSRAAVLRKAAGPRAGILFATGSLPQATYAQTVAGLSTHQLKAVQRSARRVAGSAGMQSCTFTTVLLRLGRLPIVQMQKEQIRLWLELWKRADNRSELTSAWRVTRDALAPLTLPRAWQLAAGPMAATILTLRQAGWTPSQPHLWIAPRQRLATLQAVEPHAHGDILQAVADDLELKVWEQASRHFLGEGLQQGKPNFEPAIIVRRKLLKAARDEKLAAATAVNGIEQNVTVLIPSALRAAALQTANAGGSTVGSRYNPPRPCPRCGACNETARHRYFDCTDNTSAELLSFEPSLTKTQWIGELWGKPTGQSLEPCLWGRGILPADHSHNLATAAESKFVIAGDFVAAAHASGTIYTDGSGGPKIAAAALRRVGAGAAAFHASTSADGTVHLDHIGLVFSQTPGKQSVPRAETFAGVQALSAAEPGFVRAWWSDASYTVKGAEQLHRRQAGSNGDVWVSLGAQLDRHPGLLPTKVKAHTTLDDVVAGTIPFEHYFGNGLADVAAGCAAEIFQEQEPVLREAERWFGIAIGLNWRIATIEARCWQAAAAAKVPLPILPPIPEVLPRSVVKQHALQALKDSQHRLYRFKNGFACARYQRWRSYTKSHTWPAISCVRLSRPETTQPPPDAPLSQAPTLPLDIDDPDGAIFDEDFDESELHEMGPPSDSEHDGQQALVSVSSAKSQRRAWRRATDSANAQNKANAREESATAATSQSSANFAAALNAAEVQELSACPPWAVLADRSHNLFTIGGFVFCASCGSRAASQVRKSRLTKHCTGHSTPDSRRDLIWLSQGRCPHTAEWPYGGRQPISPQSLRRVILPDSQ